MTEDWESEGGYVPKPAIYKSRKWMHKRYVIEKLNEREIAELAGTNQSTISRWLKKLELKR